MKTNILGILSLFVLVAFSFVTFQLFMKQYWTEGIIAFMFLVLPSLSVYVNNQRLKNITENANVNG